MNCYHCLACLSNTGLHSSTFIMEKNKRLYHKKERPFLEWGCLSSPLKLTQRQRAIFVFTPEGCSKFHLKTDNFLMDFLSDRLFKSSQVFVETWSNLTNSAWKQVWWRLRHRSTPLNNEPVPQFLKQVVNLSCYPWKGNSIFLFPVACLSRLQVDI